MWWLWPFTLLFVLPLVIAIVLEVLFRMVSTVSGKIARTLRTTHGALWEQLSPPEPNLKLFLPGLAILIAFFYYIGHILPFYTDAIGTVFHVSKRESSGLAIGLVVITALAGVLLDMFFFHRSDVQKSVHGRHDTEAPEAPAAPADQAALADPAGLVAAAEPVAPVANRRFNLFSAMTISVLMLILGLLAYQMIVYYEFYRKTAGGSLPIAGALKAFCIAGTEILALFLVTALCLNTLAWLVSGLALLPLSIAALLFRFIETLFGVSFRWQKEEQDPQPDPQSTGPVNTTHAVISGPSASVP